jgi:hypothetical protein
LTQGSGEVELHGLTRTLTIRSWFLEKRHGIVQHLALADRVAGGFKDGVKGGAESGEPLPPTQQVSSNPSGKPVDSNTVDVEAKNKV